MKNREKGVLTVEASLGLVIFALFVLFLFSFARVYRAQNMVGHATLQSADNIAVESYLRETAMEGDLEDILYLASLISETDTLSEGSLESLRTANLQSLAKERFTSAIALSETEADEKLRKLGVKDGINGVDFSNSRVDLEHDDIIIAVNYTIKMQFPIWGASEIDVTKSAKAKTFGEILFAITTEPNDPSMGTTTGDDKVTFGEYVEIEAIPNYGFEFVDWNDGVTDNPRLVLVTEAAHYVANFRRISMGVNLSIDNGEYGIYETDRGRVSGAGEYEYQDTVTITAAPKEHYEFVGWDENGDGVADYSEATKRFTIDQVENVYYFSALFKPKTYTITVNVNDPNKGSAIVKQGGNSGVQIQAEYGSTVQLIATVKNTVRYRFDHWSNGRTQTSTSVTVTGNDTYTAYFVNNTCKVRFLNGSTVVKTVDVIRGSSIDGSKPYTGATMPGAPASSTAVFDKWVYGNGATFTSSTTVNEDTDVRASWKYRIVFNANGGYIKGGATYTAYAYPNTAFNFSSYVPTRSGYSFANWKEGNTVYSGSRVISRNTNLTAEWNCTHPSRWEERTGSACSGGTIIYHCSQCGAILGTGTYPGTGGHCYDARCDVLHRVSYFDGRKPGGCGHLHEPGSMYCVVCINCGMHKWSSYWSWVGSKTWWCGVHGKGAPVVTPVDGHYYYNMNDHSNW